MFYLALFKPLIYFLFFYIQISWTRNTQNIWESYLDFIASMMKSTKHIWNLTQLPKVFIPNTIRSMIMLWHMKWVSCALPYFDPPKTLNLTETLWGKETWHPTSKCNTGLFFAFSKRTQLWLPKGNEKILLRRQGKMRGKERARIEK